MNRSVYEFVCSDRRHAAENLLPGRGQEPERPGVLAEIYQQVAAPQRGPFSGRAGGDAQDRYGTGLDLQHDQYIQAAASAPYPHAGSRTRGCTGVMVVVRGDA